MIRSRIRLNSHSVDQASRARVGVFFSPRHVVPEKVTSGRLVETRTGASEREGDDKKGSTTRSFRLLSHTHTITHTHTSCESSWLLACPLEHSLTFARCARSNLPVRSSSTSSLSLSLSLLGSPHPTLTFSSRRCRFWNLFANQHARRGIGRFEHVWQRSREQGRRTRDGRL